MAALLASRCPGIKAKPDRWPASSPASGPCRCGVDLRRVRRPLTLDGLDGNAVGMSVVLQTSLSAETEPPDVTMVADLIRPCWLDGQQPEPGWTG